MLAQLDRITRAAKKAKAYSGARSRRAKYGGSPLDTYRKCYPDYLDPRHLAPLFDLFERAKRDRVYACVSLPPRAGKTEGIIAGGIVDRLAEDPSSRVGYASYSQRFANKKSARARLLASRAGVPIDPTSRSKQDWRTGHDEGGLWATSVGGPITGEGFELLLLDDLIRSRADAESAAIRDTAYEWIISDALTRLEPEGSCILTGTRWHADDPIGRLVKAGWEEIAIPALSPLDESYWPERWPAERLKQIREEKGGETGYDWLSLYQQVPRAPGDRIFRDAIFCASSEVPVGAIRIGIGVDFAYTVKKSSDFSAYVVLAECEGRYFVLDARRVKETEAAFRARIKAVCESWGAQFAVGYIAATEQPNIDLLVSEGVPAIGQRAVVDKKTRALPLAAAWNVGKISVVRGVSEDLVSELSGFTGADLRDDLVDAFAAVFDMMHRGPAVDWDALDELRAAVPRAFDLHGLAMN